MQVDNQTKASFGENSPLYEKTLSVRNAFKGHAVTVDVIDIELPDGRKSVRECVRHRGAVAILARRPDGRFVFVRQYRKCIEQAYLEIPAGCMEVGEAADVAAHRELREESGYIVRKMLPLGSIFACPGYSEEQLHLFYAEVEEQPGLTDFDSDENVETLLFTENSVEKAMLDGTISDAKTLSAWLLWKLRGPHDVSSAKQESETKDNIRVIAIDGPSGAGKSTIAKGIGKRLGFLHVDSGALYRIMTLLVLRAGVDPNNAEEVAKFSASVTPDFVVRDGRVVALIDGNEAGEAIRTAEINSVVSPVSKVPEVRTRITTWLREMTRFGKLVVEGRDIGSVVFPDTPARFYLDASAEARAHRRHLEEIAKGMATQDEEAVKASLLNRDRIDSTRKTAPLKIADGAIVIDSTLLGIEEVLSLVESNIERLRR